MIRVKVYRLQPGRETQWRDWCAELQSKYADSAIATLRQEGNTKELFYEFATPDGVRYVLGIGVGSFLPVDTNNALNKEHARHKRECLAEEVDLRELYNLDTDEAV